MMKPTLLSFAILLLVGNSLNADELFGNGGFKWPITDDLSQEFHLNQQDIVPVKVPVNG
jgi:hypothetical protein